MRSGNFEILLRTNPTVDYFSNVLVLKKRIHTLEKTFVFRVFRSFGHRGKIEAIVKPIEIQKNQEFSTNRPPNG